MLMGCVWTELRVEGLINLKQSPGIDGSPRCSIAKPQAIISSWKWVDSTFLYLPLQIIFPAWTKSLR